MKLLKDSESGALDVLTKKEKAAKMLELVDVYDALTDPGRKYRDPLKPAEAVEFIRDKFLKEQQPEPIVNS